MFIAGEEVGVVPTLCNCGEDVVLEWRREYGEEIAV